MFNEELLKKLEFDIRFKYSPVYFRVNNFRILQILYFMTTTIFKLQTNDSYVEYLLEFQNIRNVTGKCDCIFFIDIDNKKSDVVSGNYARQRNYMYGEFINIQDPPDYIYQI